MKSFKTIMATAALLAASGFSLGVHAQGTSVPAAAIDGKMDKVASADYMSDGEIRKVDKDTKKITIKHGEIKNLDMPGMTMVFQIKDSILLDKVKAGDKVKFRAEKADTGLVVTAIEMAK
jgi:Cu(I)/Ag(I) efflux system protein CusF